MDQFVNNYVAPAYGTLQQAGSLVPNALSNPLVQHGLELAGIGYGAKKFLIDPFGNKMNNALDIMKNYTEKSHAAQMDYNALQREKMAAQAARTGAGAVNTAGESAFGNMAQQLGQRPPVAGAPVTPPPAPAPTPPPVGGPAAQQGANFLENMASKFGSLAQRVAPV